MKYRLKDRELQRKLEDLDDGDFTDFPIRLNETINDLLTIHQFERLPKTFCVNFGEDLSQGRGECPNFRHSITLFNFEVTEDEE